MSLIQVISEYKSLTTTVILEQKLGSKGRGVEQFNSPLGMLLIQK
jgi:hypothetical protein